MNMPGRFIAAIAVVVAILAILIMLANKAFSQAACGPKDALLAALSASYAETPAATFTVLFGGRHIPAELRVNPATGSMTLIVFPDAATACMVVTGTNFRPAVPAPKPEGTAL